MVSAQARAEIDRMVAGRREAAARPSSPRTVEQDRRDWEAAARLTVLPFDADRADQSQRDPAFGRRIARNVQHLLKMESGLDQFPDPAAGSYYVEQLTGKYAEMAWFDCFTEALQRKAQGGPF